jgi:hypothetical protein
MNGLKLVNSTTYLGTVSKGELSDSQMLKRQPIGMKSHTMKELTQAANRANLDERG